MMPKIRNFVDNDDLKAFLAEVPLFSTIPRAQLQELASLFEPLFAEKGETICRQGESGDSMYIIKSGAVGMYVTSEKREMFVTYLHRGEFFGDMDLLTQKTRTATIKVILDTHLYRLQRHNFEQLLRDNPSISLYLSRLYAHRFAQSTQQILDDPPPTFFAIMATHARLGKSSLLYSLAYHLTDETQKKVLVVELGPTSEKSIEQYGLQQALCPNPKLIASFSAQYIKLLQEAWRCHPVGFMVFFMPRVQEKRYWQELKTNLPDIMELLRQQFSLVFFNIPHRMQTVERRVLRLCDIILLLINNTQEGFPHVSKKLATLQRMRSRSLEPIKVGVSHLAGKHGIPRETLRVKLHLPETPNVWVPRNEATLADHIDMERSFPVRGSRALARELGRIRVGLALGAGGARGWASVGVLKVLEEEGIHIDMIAGTSIGALVGSVYAQTASATMTQTLTSDQFSTKLQTRRLLFDYTIPLRGIIRGQKIFQMLRKGLGDADFLDLLIPTYIVAVDIFTGEEVLLERGRVSEAIMASISIPGIFPPVCVDGRWLVDGGLLNPVPVDILVRKGADIVIAVCVTRKRGAERCVGPPSIIDVLSRTINVVHNQVTKDVAKRANIVIYPKVDDFAWDDFHRGRELMQVGMQACREQIAEIKKMIADKGR